MSSDGTTAASIDGTVFKDDTPEVTRSYAEALINAAEREGQVDDALEEIEGIASVLKAQPRFADILASPLKSPADKDQLLVRTFEGRAMPLVVRFLRVLNRRGRLGSVGNVARGARAIWDRRQNRQPVLVRSAVPLDDAERDSLRDRLAKMLNATPLLNLQVDPRLIGGIVVQVGDVVYDASVRNRLEQLRQRLIEGKTHEIQSRRDHFSHPA